MQKCVQLYREYVVWLVMIVETLHGNKVIYISIIVRWYFSDYIFIYLYCWFTALHSSIMHCTKPHCCRVLLNFYNKGAATNVTFGMMFLGPKNQMGYKDIVLGIYGIVRVTFYSCPYCFYSNSVYNYLFFICVVYLFFLYCVLTCYMLKISAWR